MPRGLTFEIQALGTEEASQDLEGVEQRILHAEPAFTEIERILEQGEQRHFNRLHGKYVRTGATRASLTQPSANGAIREAHTDQLIFGTKIWYAKFLRKKKKSAVLVLLPKERKAITQTMLDHITNGDSGTHADR
jgi:hypothetical protein